MTLACLFKCSLLNIVVYGSLICIFFMNTFGNRSIVVQDNDVADSAPCNVDSIARQRLN